MCIVSPSRTEMIFFFYSMCNCKILTRNAFRTNTSIYIYYNENYITFHLKHTIILIALSMNKYQVLIAID